MYLIIAGLGLAVLCWVIPLLLHKILRSDVVEESSLPPLVLSIDAHRHLMPLLALPTIAFGIVMLFKVPWRYVWLGLGLLVMLVPAVLLLYVFVVAMSALYDPAPL